MKFINNTNEKYVITKDKRVVNFKTKRELTNNNGVVWVPYVTGRVGKQVEMLYNEHYVAPTIMRRIPGFNNMYGVTNDGRIYSFYKHKFVSPFYDKDGYKRLALMCTDGVRRKYRVCRLVAMTFLPNPNNHPIVNHIDENKANDNWVNLEWCTYSHNAHHSKAWLKRDRDESGKFI